MTPVNEPKQEQHTAAVHCEIGLSASVLIKCHHASYFCSEDKQMTSLTVFLSSEYRPRRPVNDQTFRSFFESHNERVTSALHYKRSTTNEHTCTCNNSMSPESWSSFHSRHQSTQFRESSSGSLLSLSSSRRRSRGILSCLASLVNGGARTRRSRRNSASSPTIYNFHDEIESDLGYNFTSPRSTHHRLG